MAVDGPMVAGSLVETRSTERDSLGAHLGRNSVYLIL